ncbi:MAG: histidine kinase dimerization/phospho-acceptor domain-containing protein, partial [Thermodesulfobacteriota bacterium]
MGWWPSLRGRIFLILAALALVTVAGGVVTIWYTHRMEALFTQSVDKEVAATLRGEALLRALVEERGFVSYYFMDGDVKWLERLKEQRRAFRDLLADTQRSAASAGDRDKLQQIEKRYGQYAESKDRVIDLYKSGRREEGRILHQAVRAYFDDILDLVEAYEATKIQRLQRMQQESKRRATWMHGVAAAAILLTVALSLVLAFVLLRQIFGPIRVLLGEAERFGGAKTSSDELKALGLEVRGLIEDADQTHQELEKSRTRLLHTEKMATVGRLAAGVAHSIRNPLTSIKMRLFSLERSLDLAPDQKEDLEVISEETRHLDTIIRNFLEYARPSKLRMQRISPSELIDMTLHLLRHRFKSYGVRSELVRTSPLPEILADPDQLKEVFMNILINACEAVGEDGKIRIEEEEEMQESPGPVAVIRISDNGPGVPADLQEKVFEPFFSTKE